MYLCIYIHMHNVEWRPVNPETAQVCNGYWFFNSNGDNVYAYKPSDGRTPTGGSTSGSAISQEDAIISATWCAEQMKNSFQCSQQFIGVAHHNGHCWCAHKGGDCSNNPAIVAILQGGGHFFEAQVAGQLPY